MNKLTLDTGTQVFFYEQDHYYLSNFSAFEVRHNGIYFKTAEHAYQCAKFHGLSHMRMKVQSLIINARSAHDAYKIAQEHKAKRVPEWDDLKEHVMYDILVRKVQGHEYVRRKLRETQGKTLIENSWRDDVWGWGPYRDGQNLLGNTWMRVRTDLIEGRIGGCG